MDITEVCTLLCPVSDDTDAAITHYSWIGAGLFILSELIGAADIPQSGVLHTITHALHSIFTNRNTIETPQDNANHLKAG